MTTMEKISLPLSVPASQASEYRKNFSSLTNSKGRLLLIAGDQKIEHLNNDFFGSGIAPEDAEPEHLFRIARAAKHGALAVPLGLASRYGQQYRDLNYIIKINGKTNLGDNEAKDSHKPFWTVDDILRFKKQSKLNIAAIGYTIYLGGRYESQLLAAAAQATWQAHQSGLLSVLWIYPRGKGIKEEDVHTIAGAAGVAASLDADFVKLKYPVGAKDIKRAAKRYQEVTKAAGRTKVICVGGGQRPASELLAELEVQLNISGTSGLAIGRNLHQRPLAEANRLTEAIGAMLWHEAKTKEAINLYKGRKKKTPARNSRFLGLF